jgi:hypothetical protein
MKTVFPIKSATTTAVTVEEDGPEPVYRDAS